MDESIRSGVAPLVSVIIPIYNTEMYIAECLESVLDQDYQNFEIVCVDDTSTDTSPDVLKRYAGRDSRLKVTRIADGPNGPGYARNLGMKIAQGKWISFIDSDDMVEPDFLSSLLDAGESLNADVAMCLLKKFSSSGHNEAFGKCTYDALIPTELDGQSFCWDSISDSIFQLRFASCNKLYRKRFLSGNGLKYPEGIFYEDLQFTFRCLLSADALCLVRAPLYLNRRQRPGATTNEQGGHVVGAIQAFDGLEGWLESQPEYADLMPSFFAFRFRKMLEYFPKNGPETIGEFYIQMQQWAHDMKLKSEELLSADDRDHLRRIRDMTMFEYLTWQVWELKKQKAGLARKLRSARSSNKNLKATNRKLKDRVDRLEGRSTFRHFVGKMKSWALSFNKSEARARR